MLNVSIEMRRRREAVWILVGGVVVAAAPAFWYARVWPDAVTRYGQNDGPSHGAWWFLFVCSIAPFILVAVLRERGSMSRIATSVAVLAVGVIVVLGQLAGLNPNDPSSTAQKQFTNFGASGTLLFALLTSLLLARLFRRTDSGSRTA